MTRKWKNAKHLYAKCDCDRTHGFVVRHTQHPDTKEIQCSFCGTVKSKECATELKMISAEKVYDSLMGGVRRKYSGLCFNGLKPSSLEQLCKMCNDFRNVEKIVKNLYQKTSDICSVEQYPIPIDIVELIDNSMFSIRPHEFPVSYMHKIYAINTNGDKLVYDQMIKSFRILKNVEL
jgi:hypothetical protein